jgi:hypothetical protein
MLRIECGGASCPGAPPCSCRFQHLQNLRGMLVFSSVEHISLHSRAKNAAHGSRKQQTHAVRSENETAGLAAG